MGVFRRSSNCPNMQGSRSSLGFYCADLPLPPLSGCFSDTVFEFALVFERVAGNLYLTQNPPFILQGCYTAHRRRALLSRSLFNNDQELGRYFHSKRFSFLSKKRSFLLGGTQRKVLSPTNHTHTSNGSHSLLYRSHCVAM